jgi:translation elongation factor EF-Tu-like GTPase
MNTESIYITAKLTLYSTDKGGRKTGIRTGYRPNHVFEYDNKGSFKQTYIGQINFDDGKWIMPGETDEVTVEFLNLFDIAKFLTIGRKWWIHEGNNKLGEAVIIDIKSK